MEKQFENLKVKVICNAPYCLNSEFIEWKGGFIEPFYCEKHRNLKK